MIPNKKHQIFADEYVLTSDAIVSYQKEMELIALTNLRIYETKK